MGHNFFLFFFQNYGGANVSGGRGGEGEGEGDGQKK